MSSQENRNKLVLSEEFEISDVRVIDHGNLGADPYRARDKSWLLRLLVWCTVIVVVVTGAFGLFTGDFRLLQSIWNFVGPIWGLLFNHYFKND